MKRSLAIQRQVTRTARAVAVVEPLRVEDQLRALLVESLYIAQREGVEIHPLLLEAAERKRRELLMKEALFNEEQKQATLKTRLLEATLEKIASTSRRKIPSRILSLQIKTIYGLASDDEQKTLDAWYIEHPEFEPTETDETAPDQEAD